MYRIYAYRGDRRWLVGFGYKRIEAAERAQERMYAARVEHDDTDFIIE